MGHGFLRRGGFGLALAMMVAVGSSPVQAHGGAMGVMKERMELMKEMGEAMKAMAAMFKGQAPYDHGVLADRAGYLAEHARRIPAMTPAGSGAPPSEALGVIWEDWDGYVEGAERLAAAGGDLVALARSGADQRATKRQFAKVSKTCGGCHKKYRRPEGDQRR